MDIKQLKKDHPIEDFIHGYIVGGLKKKGVEYVGLCPFHGDDHPSLMVSPRKQICKCFVCGKGGDIIDFVMLYGNTFEEAVKIISGTEIKKMEPGQYYVAPDDRKKWIQVKPVPTTAPKPNFNYHYLGDPSHQWVYRDAENKLLGFVLRYNKGNKKEIRQLTYCTDGKNFYWRFQGFDKPRPLYNLPDFTKYASHSVMMVEGEKAADKGNTLFNKRMIVTSWQGGVEGVRHADFTPLHGRTVYLWPDNDINHKYPEGHEKAGEILPFDQQPGNRAMLEIYNLIKDKAKAVKWIRNSDNFPDKWDIADAIWTPEEAQAYVKDNVIDVPGSNVVQFKGSDNNNTPPPASKEKTKMGSNLPFKVLGFEKQETGPNKYWFYSFETNSTTALKPDQMKPENLISIANYQWWVKKFPSKRDGIDKMSVVSTLVEMGNKVGVFSAADFRGRGAWVDKGRIVVHAGDHLIVDSKHVGFNKFESNYIYEQTKLLDIDVNKPLSNKESIQLMEITKLLNWERQANAPLLAGWIFLAPICGALKWRPHIWITGPAGSGKSTVLHEIIRPLIHNIALVFQGKTTEPGVRQVLKNDAVPILFDEADIDDRRDIERVQSVLSLMRSSSTNDGGLLSKGSSSQVARTFTTKAMFCFASISVKTAQYSDQSRVSVLSLKANANDPDKYEELLRKISSVISEEYARRLQARAITMIPTILKNAQMFAKAAALVIGQQRTGDQIGSLLAGSYALQYNDFVDLDTAKAYVSQFEWQEEKGLELSKDELLLLQYLMEQLVMVEDQGGAKMERSIGELIALASGHRVSDLPPSNCDERLRRMGIKHDGNYIIIANNNKHILRILEGTNWATNYHKILLRLEGAMAMDPTSFNSAMKSRAVKIPIGHVSNPLPPPPKKDPPPPGPDVNNGGSGGGMQVPEYIPEEELPF